ncbi:MAG: 4Fe-4S dicluster domain-containing protein [Asgard group archaeon]|nr:4Fe-4S dicluster domain-containing protein [Asgard group archaeon]
MHYRLLGKTGLKVSEISLGTEWLEKKSPEEITSVIRRAIEKGVNYIDIIFNFDEHLQKISKAIEGNREKLILVHHMGSSEYKGKYKKNRSIKSCTETFDKYLKIMKTDYVDILFIHFVLKEKNYDEIMNKPNGLYDLARKFKEENKTKFIGISTHDLKIVEKAATSNKFDVIMYQINLANNALKNRNKVLSICAKNGIGVIAMKPFAGGALIKLKETVTIGSWRSGGMSLKKKIPAIATPVKCLHYILSQVGVSTTVPGVASIEELDEIMTYSNASDEEKDYSMLLKEFDEYITGECVYCNHCQPCPEDIDIGRIFKLYDQATSVGEIEKILGDYMKFGVLASYCTECGNCMERCPFEVDIINKMLEVEKLFEKQ